MRTRMVLRMLIMLNTSILVEGELKSREACYVLLRSLAALGHGDKGDEAAIVTVEEVKGEGMKGGNPRFYLLRSIRLTCAYKLYT